MKTETLEKENKTLDSNIDNSNWNITWDKVSKTYPNGTRGLTNVSLSIKQGEFVAIIGLSGAGKTT